MPIENRQIIFKWHEVFRAIARYRDRQGNPFPAGTFRSKTIHRRPELAVDIVMDDDKAGEISYRISYKEIAAALIQFCIEERIVLPKHNAIKEIGVFDDQIGLVITLGQPKLIVESQVCSQQA